MLTMDAATFQRDFRRLQSAYHEPVCVITGGKAIGGFLSPEDPASAIALPAAVKTALGLDREASWICVDELNSFAWPGYDLRPVPGTNEISYGALPRPLFE